MLHSPIHRVPVPDQGNGTAGAGHAEEEDLRAMEESMTPGAIAEAEQLEARVAKLNSIIFQCRAWRGEASIEASPGRLELPTLCFESFERRSTFGCISKVGSLMSEEARPARHAGEEGRCLR